MSESAIVVLLWIAFVIGMAALLRPWETWQ